MDLNDKVCLLRPNEPFYLVGDTLDGLTFQNPKVKPISQAELDSETPRLEYEFAVMQVQSLRQSAYQVEADPLFFKYQRSEDGVTKQAWLDKIDEVRARYPLPETF